MIVNSILWHENRVIEQLQHNFCESRRVGLIIFSSMLCMLSDIVDINMQKKNVQPTLLFVVIIYLPVVLAGVLICMSSLPIYNSARIIPFHGPW